MIKPSKEGPILKEWLDVIADEEPDLVMYEGFDDAILGVGRQGTGSALVYDSTEVINILMGQGMTLEDAFEHFDYNILGMWAGDHTPIFMERWKLEPDERETGDDGESA
mgnify:CR=1 FL=1|jgi:hypothetical protein|tara:strand:- start:367 stop:693 length:327 start_codon:yes stop_codon:yes gene_type:complete